MYTIGTTPEDVLRTALGDEPYRMQLMCGDVRAVIACVNQGIDSHLTACYLPSRGDRYTQAGNRLVCSVSTESMLVLLRRLHEADTSNAWDLRSCILSTLDIEEV